MKRFAVTAPGRNKRGLERISPAWSPWTTSASANREGLISLANILVDLAKEGPGAHVHLDENNSLEDGSAELIIERV